MDTIGFLATPDVTDQARALFEDDIAELGYVMNVSRLWAYQPATVTDLFELLKQVNSVDRLSLRQRGILVVAFASAAGDSYCSLAWGNKLAKASDPGTAAAVLSGTDDGLSTSERAMARWARKVAREPNRTSQADVQVLRDAGFTDSQIFTMTVFVALRLAYATVNDALGLLPDAALQGTTPSSVRDLVTFGRPIEPQAQPWAARTR
jgi:uncharacterized peroxidase-related enzyme